MCRYLPCCCGNGAAHCVPNACQTWQTHQPTFGNADEKSARLKINLNYLWLWVTRCNVQPGFNLLLQPFRTTVALTLTDTRSGWEPPCCCWRTCCCVNAEALSVAATDVRWMKWDARYDNCSFPPGDVNYVVHDNSWTKTCEVFCSWRAARKHQVGS